MAKIARLNKLEQAEKEQIYKLLIPRGICSKFGVDPEKGVNSFGQRAIRIECCECEQEGSVGVNHTQNEKDPIFYIEVSDSKDLVQLKWEFININDPSGPRFNTDVTSDGHDRWLRWTSRNIEQEKAALEAGLAPGQVRKGLRMMNEVNEGLDKFCKVLGFKSIFMEALFYHNAVCYERHGFRYFEGEKLMRWIDMEFRPGGRLHRLLDGSIFRQKDFYKSVRGRSWAIHDGILEECGDEIYDYWSPPKMYRMVGECHRIDTFPGGIY